MAIAVAFPDAGLLVHGSTMPTVPPQPTAMPPFAVEILKPEEPHTSPGPASTEPMSMPSCALSLDVPFVVDLCAAIPAFVAAVLGTWFFLFLRAMLQMRPHAQVKPPP